MRSSGVDRRDEVVYIDIAACVNRHKACAVSCVDLYRASYIKLHVMTLPLVKAVEVTPAVSAAVEIRTDVTHTAYTFVFNILSVDSRPQG